MSKINTYGPEADAAALRAALQCGITPEKMHDFKKLVFKTFGIRGPHSYRRIKTALQIAGAIDILVETVAEHDDRDELSDFVVSFLNLHKRQEKLRDDDSLSLVESEGDFFSNEPQNQLQIIDCELKNCMLAEEQQLIKYFDLPQLSFAQLRHDFDYAHHLQFLNEIEDIKTLLFLGKQETGLLACKYLSAWITQELEEELDEDEYQALIGKMPVVYGSDIYRWHGTVPVSRRSFAGSISFEFRSQENQDMTDPWWTSYDEIPLVIIIEPDEFLGSDFIDKIKLLQETHRNVWIICEEYPHKEYQRAFRGRLGSLQQQIIDDIYWTLNYPVYKIEEPDIKSEYYQMVLKNAVARHAYQIAPEVNTVDLLERLKKYRNHKFCGNTTIIEMANKAVALKQDDTEGILYQNDFAFVGQSLIELYQNQSQELPQPAINAIDQMNKKVWGLKQVKSQIMETVNILKLRALREKEGLKTEGLATHNTCIFTGPPGVGKTEIAKHFAAILFEDNLLPGCNFLNINAAELKAPYVGHTAPKIAEIFESYDAIFLDEAYSLSASHNGQMDIFSQEALAQLCVELEKHAADKLVILAGYGGDLNDENNKMKHFLNANPGIASRITFHFNFPSYSPDQEMPEIFKLMAENAGWVLEEGWSSIVIDFFSERSKEENYGNAREGRRLLQQAITIRASRLDLSQGLPVNELNTLSCSDLKQAAFRILDAEKILKGRNRGSIGFKGNVAREFE